MSNRTRAQALASALPRSAVSAPSGWPESWTNSPSSKAAEAANRIAVPTSHCHHMANTRFAGMALTVISLAPPNASIKELTCNELPLSQAERVVCASFNYAYNYGSSDFADSTGSLGIAVYLQPPWRSHLQRCHPHCGSRRPAPSGSRSQCDHIARAFTPDILRTIGTVRAGGGTTHKSDFAHTASAIFAAQQSCTGRKIHHYGYG
jgi:hypothetical protein